MAEGLAFCYIIACNDCKALGISYLERPGNDASWRRLRDLGCGAYGFPRGLDETGFGLKC